MSGKIVTVSLRALVCIWAAMVFAVATACTSQISTPTPETSGVQTVDAVTGFETTRSDVVSSSQDGQTDETAETAEQTPESVEPAPIEPTVNEPDAQTAVDYSDVLCVGDSVMASAFDSLAVMLPGAAVNALQGRSFDDGGPQTSYDELQGVIDIVRADVCSHRRYVVSAGVNDWARLEPARLEELVSAVGDADVFIVVPCISDNIASTIVVGETLRIMADAHENVHLCDWRSWASEHSAELADGCCPETQNARDTYAAIIRDEIERCANNG